MHKICNISIVALLTFENRSDTVISRINFNSKCYDQYQFALNLIQLASIFKLVRLYVVQLQ